MKPKTVSPKERILILTAMVVIGLTCTFMGMQLGEIYGEGTAHYRRGYQDGLKDGSNKMIITMQRRGVDPRVIPPSFVPLEKSRHTRPTPLELLVKDDPMQFNEFSDKWDQYHRTHGRPK